MKSTIIGNGKRLTFAVALGGVMALPLLFARADHQAGATYIGGHGGNGAVAVVVSANGLTLSFQAQAVPVDMFDPACGNVNVSFANVPIQTILDYHYFERSQLVGETMVYVDGDFDVPDFVTGYIETERGGCWNLTTFAAAIPNGNELPPGQGDTDGDLLTDLVEYTLRQCPSSNDPDSDDDALTEGVEAVVGTGACIADSDKDGLTDGVEVYIASLRGAPCPHPLDRDSDGDGWRDGQERSRGTNYCNRLSHP